MRFFHGLLYALGLGALFYTLLYLLIWSIG